MAQGLVDRMRGAAALDVATYEEVENDLTATGQAATVVAIAAVAAAIGASRQGSGGVIATLLASLLGWALWAGVTYVVGTKLMDGTATWGELLRTLGFAQSPRILLVLGIIPVLGRLVVLVVGIWTLVTGVVAIRQALDITTGKAIVTAVVSLIAIIVVTAVLGTIFGVGAALSMRGA
ncbi:MAG TPA: YIP1 family protein [Gemmatimonadaceae bacterium]|nr:YIP1 family protein [Gemmatimonadaceae bacterium]